MRARRFVLGALLLAMVGACRPDTVELRYRYPDRSIAYRMQAEANAHWDIGGPGRGNYVVTFRVTETVQSGDGEGATVTVTMEPTKVVENGLPSPGSEERSFALRIGASGEVLEVLEVDGVPADALDPDELIFIGTYRPPLPQSRVRLGEEWEAEQEVRVGAVFQQFVTTGSLDSLDRDQAGKIAQLSYSNVGPLLWSTQLPQGQAELIGSASTISEAVLDIDGGFLREAGSSTSGEFEVRVDPGGQQAPITGTLNLDLELDLHKI